MPHSRCVELDALALRAPPRATGSSSARICSSSGAGRDERDHDLDLRVAALLLAPAPPPRRSRGPASRRGRASRSRAAPAQAEHRVGLVQLGRPSPRIALPRSTTSSVAQRPRPRRAPPPGRRRPRARPGSGRNSCSGGSSSRTVTGQPAPSRVKMPTKSSRCSGSSASYAVCSSASVSGEDHLAHRAHALLAEEHVLGAAQADALGAAFRALRRLVRACRRSRARAGAGARPRSPSAARTPSRSSPREPSASPDRAFSSTDSSSGSSPRNTLPVKPSIVMTSPSCTVVPFAVKVPRREVELDRVGAAHRRDALAARHDRGVRVRPAGARQDALRGDHAVVVVRAWSRAGRGSTFVAGVRRTPGRRRRVNTTAPVAAPGLALRPFAIGVARRRPSTRRLNSSSRRSASTRSSASSSSIRPSSSMS